MPQPLSHSRLLSGNAGIPSRSRAVPEVHQDSGNSLHFIFLNTNRDRNICLSRPGLTEVSAGFYMFMTALTASLRLKLDCSAKNST
ncbi:hypothetical protein AOLI_G00318050 [Acnodon oligacanthus]